MSEELRGFAERLRTQAVLIEDFVKAMKSGKVTSSDVEPDTGALIDMTAMRADDFQAILDALTKIADEMAAAG